MVTQLPTQRVGRHPDPNRAERYRRALCDSDLPGIARLIAHTLAAHVDAAGAADLSRTELARAAGIDRSAVTRNLPTLTGRSWVLAEVPPAAEARRGARTRWTITIPAEVATVTAIEPGRPPLTVRRLAARLHCTPAEAAAVIAAIRVEAGGNVRNMGGLLRSMPDDELAEYLDDVRTAPADAGAAEAQPEWCSDHDNAGGTLPNGQPRCPICRKNAGGATTSRRTPPDSPKRREPR
jgi:hypothetical protein